VGAAAVSVELQEEEEVPALCNSMMRMAPAAGPDEDR